MSGRSREDLERALRALGLRCRIEEWDALAVAVPEPGDRGFENDALREQALALARAHGFSHLALEVTDGESGASSRAAVPGD